MIWVNRMMTCNSALVRLCALGLAVVALQAPAALAQGEDDFEDFMEMLNQGKADRKLCLNLAGETDKKTQAAACTRLIEDAPRENDVVGTYYVARATATDDLESQCRDVRKGIAVIEKSKSTIYGKDYLDSARRLEDSACR